MIDANILVAGIGGIVIGGLIGYLYHISSECYGRHNYMKFHYENQIDRLESKIKSLELEKDVLVIELDKKNRRDC